jgi:hypothetical protein
MSDVSDEHSMAARGTLRRAFLEQLGWPSKGALPYHPQMLPRVVYEDHAARPGAGLWWATVPQPYLTEAGRVAATRAYFVTVDDALAWAGHVWSVTHERPLSPDVLPTPVVQFTYRADDPVEQAAHAAWRATAPGRWADVQPAVTLVSRLWDPALVQSATPAHRVAAAADDLALWEPVDEGETLRLATDGDPLDHRRGPAAAYAGSAAGYVLPGAPEDHRAIVQREVYDPPETPTGADRLARWRALRIVEPVPGVFALWYPDPTEPVGGAFLPRDYKHDARPYHHADPEMLLRRAQLQWAVAIQTSPLPGEGVVLPRDLPPIPHGELPAAAVRHFIQCCPEVLAPTAASRPGQGVTPRAVDIG